MTQRALLGAALACLWAALGRAEVQFVEVAAEAGIAFRHQNGAEGQKYPMETMGSGAAFCDYDGDGWLDLYFVNSAGPSALYRNASAGQFTDATNAAGVADPGYGLGCAAADYDSDGDLDLYITAYGPNTLYRNEGTGRFTDATDAAGVAGPALVNPAMRYGRGLCRLRLRRRLGLLRGQLRQVPSRNTRALHPLRRDCSVLRAGGLRAAARRLLSQ